MPSLVGSEMCIRDRYQRRVHGGKYIKNNNYYYYFLQIMSDLQQSTVEISNYKGMAQFGCHNKVMLPLSQNKWKYISILATYFTLTLFYYFIIFPNLLFQQSLYDLIITGLILILVLYNFLMASFRDPGILLTTDDKQTLSETLVEQKVEMKQLTTVDIQNQTEQNTKEENSLITQKDLKLSIDQSKESISHPPLPLAETYGDNIYQIPIFTKRHCKTCNIEKPPMTSHCKYCNHCVRGFDHHCFFIGNCVGIRNYKNFVCFIIFATIMVSFFLIQSLTSLVILSDNQSEIYKLFYHNKIAFYIGLCLTFLLFFFLICSKSLTKDLQLVVFILLMIELVIVTTYNTVITCKKKIYQNPALSALGFVIYLSCLLIAFPVLGQYLYLVVHGLTQKQEDSFYKAGKIQQLHKLPCSKKIKLFIKFFQQTIPKSQLNLI
eukprot:TRINITY_DN11478_c0_g1_i2.p1 TRINITY_DN11478_c0_g1~~TRINITY_DN11478_c0_g1_i2.p1  ORF type:complete len:435 (-),score=41.70 TRINITY_DN11478_c0_g1_i2:507-1811(-)